MGEIVSVRCPKSVLEQRPAVLPVLHLIPGANDEEQQPGPRQERKRPSGWIWFCRKRGNPPGDYQEDADQGDIGIPVGHGMPAQLDESAHGQERADVPQPTDKEKRTVIFNLYHPEAKELIELSEKDGALTLAGHWGLCRALEEGILPFLSSQVAEDLMTLDALYKCMSGPATTQEDISDDDEDGWLWEDLLMDFDDDLSDL